MSLFNMTSHPIILASQSPRRKQLLEWAALDFEVQVSHADETFDASLTPDQAALFIAQQKASVVQVLPGNQDRIILAADTIVVAGGQILGKPTDRDDAIRMLSLLSGQTHLVITGVVMLKGEKKIAFSDCTEVVFHSLTREQIAFYIDHYRPYDKAGAYAIQEWIGVVGIASIKGDFYNVMGLPVSRVLQALRDL